MKEVLHIAKWEFFKILKTRLSKVLLGVLAVLMIGITINEYNQHALSQEDDIKAKNEAFDANWRDREKLLIEQTENYMQDPYYSEIEKEAIRKRIEIAEYKLENNIPRNIYKNTWYFFSDNVFKGVSVIITLCVAIIAAYSIASEYSDKTITQLLLLPYKRYKLLIAKYLAVFMYAILCLGSVMVLGALSGLVVYGISGTKDVIILSGANGPFVLSSFVYSMIVVLMSIIEISLMVFMAMMIATLTRSSSLATILTALMLIVVKPLSIFCASYGGMWQYTPFLNSDLRKYLEFGSVMPSIENFFTNNVAAGMTWQLSMLIVIGYCGLFIAGTYHMFCNQDIK